MSFDFKKYITDNQLLKEDSEEKYPLIAVEKAALLAKEMGIERQTVVDIVNQTYGAGMTANLDKNI